MTSRLEQPSSPIWGAKRLRLAVEAAGVGLWSWNVDSDSLTMDDRAFDLWGVARGETVSFDVLSSHIHPADRDRVKAAFSATRAFVGAYEIDFRVIVEDEIRWISCRGQGDDAGILDGLMFGIFLDATGRKYAEEANELLAGEMSHRVKNLLAIAAGLTAITSRSSKTTEDMARELTVRLTSLGRAHDLVRPEHGQENKAALLGDLLSVLLAPYDDKGAFSGRVRVAVPRISVGEKATTALALVVHELATNALKYGAFSIPEGTLDVSGTLHDGEAVLIWTERGGPSVIAPTDAPGYGSKLVARSVSGPLSGSINRNWSHEGLIVTLQMSVGRLAG
jgi:two-component sensor histidine kinase